MSTDAEPTPLEPNDEQAEAIIPIINPKEAERLKAEGTEHFFAQRWNEAMAAYQSALGYLPKREIKEKPVDVQLPEDDDTLKDKKLSTEELVSNDVTPPPLDATAKIRAVLNANIGACYVKLGEHQKAVTACTEALLDDPRYVKALQRRAASNETIGSWSALTSTQEDYKTLIAILPPSSPQSVQINRSLQSLQPRVEAAQKREMDDMVGKLKELGNSFLGNFGLSTNNFKFEPNGQGGYSMGFDQ